jgi:tripartite-type tricarboxylate transporter receptor subunit TctC
VSTCRARREIGGKCAFAHPRLGIVAPPKTPRGILDKINADVNEALGQPEVRDHLRKLSAEIFGGSIETATRYMDEEIDRRGTVIKAAKIEMQ